MIVGSRRAKISRRCEFQLWPVKDFPLANAGASACCKSETPAMDTQATEGDTWKLIEAFQWEIYFAKDAFEFPSVLPLVSESRSGRRSARLRH